MDSSATSQKQSDEPGDACEDSDGAGGSVEDNLNDQVWAGLLALDERIFRERKIRLLTPDARVLIHLKLRGPMPVTRAMQHAGTSYRGFYAVLERLKAAGIVGTVKDAKDQRVRKLKVKELSTDNSITF